MNELKKEELATYEHYMTVKDLLDFIEKHNIPLDSKVMIQRVQDVYYDKHNWKVYLKEGEESGYMRWHNEQCKTNYLDKEQYPNLTEELLETYSEEEIRKSMTQYHPAWSCVKYKDDDMLFIDLHW